MKFLNLSLFTIFNLANLSEAANPWIWCYQLSKNGKDFDCYSQNNLDEYFHAHLLPYINSNYRINYNNDEDDSNSKVTFDNYGCLDAFDNPVTNFNKKQWRWEPCHIDSVKYQRFEKYGATKFAIGIYLQQEYDHSYNDSCDAHIRCDAVMIVKDKNPSKPKFVSVKCYQHDRIMNYEDAKKWRDMARESS